jgi:hypothetical protein
MPKYNFVSPDGKTYQVDAAAGTSEAQARQIFNTQFSTGSLTNLSVGSTLSAVTQAAAGLSSALALIPKNPTSGLTSAVSKLTAFPVANGINTANFLKTSQPSTGIGVLDTTQVQGLLAQTAAGLNQSAATVSATNGIGKFGISPQQLEQQGYLKPGTSSAYLDNPAQLSSVLNSPSVWTGKDGISNLTSFTGNTNKQTNIFQGLMQSNYTSLSQAGAITNNLPVKEIAPLLQVANKFGAGSAMAWSKSNAPASIVNEANKLAKQGEFAMSFVSTKLPIGATGEAKAVGYNNTVNRSSVDQAVKSILGNDKIPNPSYSTQSFTEAATLAQQGTGFNFNINSLTGALGIVSSTSIATPGFNPSVGSTSSNTDTLANANTRREAVARMTTAQANYEQILRANNNNRSAPAVEVAFAEYKAAIAAV